MEQIGGAGGMIRKCSESVVSGARVRRNTRANGRHTFGIRADDESDPRTNENDDPGPGEMPYR